jgi:hypothetical protein
MGHLVTLRGLGGTTNDGTVADTVRVRYGPVNTTTICYAQWWFVRTMFAPKECRPGPC